MHRGAVEFRFKEDADTLKCKIMTCDLKNSSYFCKNFAEKFLLFWHSLINSIHVLDNLLLSGPVRRVKTAIWVILTDLTVRAPGLICESPFLRTYINKGSSDRARSRRRTPAGRTLPFQCRAWISSAQMSVKVSAITSASALKLSESPSRVMRRISVSPSGRSKYAFTPTIVVNQVPNCVSQCSISFCYSCDWFSSK